MKSIIKFALGLVLFFAIIGTVGACEAGNISPLHCLIQGGICALGLYALTWRIAK